MKGMKDKPVINPALRTAKSGLALLGKGKHRNICDVEVQCVHLREYHGNAQGG